MKVICTYSLELERFLKKLVKYVLDKYGDDLCLRNLNSIELVSKDTIPYVTDGQVRNSGTQVILTSRLYELLPSLNMQELYGNPYFNMIVNTLYHELIHVNDWTNMPTLYTLVEVQKEPKHSIPGTLWLEYLAEKRSCSENLVSYEEFCTDFVSREWRANQFNYQYANEQNFYYLIKASSYFMARTSNKERRENYLRKMKNKLLRSFIYELDKELINLEKQPLFDDPHQLENLYLIMDKYFRKFRQTFK